MTYFLSRRIRAIHRWRGPAAGILLIISGAMLLPVADAAIKLLSHRYTILQLLWIRFFFPCLLVVSITRYRHGKRFFVTGRPVLLLGRGLLWISATFCFSTAIKFVPLADAIAVVFFSSVVLIILSWLVLRERVSPTRWIAVGLGLLATMIIIRPGFGEVSPAILFALGTAILWGGYLFSSRLLSSSDPPLVVMTYQLLALHLQSCQIKVEEDNLVGLCLHLGCQKVWELTSKN